MIGAILIPDLSYTKYLNWKIRLDKVMNKIDQISKGIMQLFKEEQFEAYKTQLSFTAYRDMVSKYVNLYVKDTPDGIKVEWKLNRGIFVTATCKFVPGSDSNIIEVSARVKHAASYKYLLILWVILGGLWIIFIPSILSLSSSLLGVLAMISLWSYATSNRNTLLKNLSPSSS